MKIVMINRASNVGKTTLAANMFHQFMSTPSFFAVETANMTAKELGVDAKVFAPEQFKSVLKEILSVRNGDVILDVGGSKNFTDFFENLRLGGFVRAFDYFVIPVVPNDSKVAEETAMTIMDLLTVLKVPPAKIRVVFNKVTQFSDFGMVPKLCDDYMIRTATVFESQIYGGLVEKGATLAAALQDPNTADDYTDIIATAAPGSSEFDKAFEWLYIAETRDEVQAKMVEAWRSLKVA